jgi:hypothetical protein
LAVTPRQAIVAVIAMELVSFLKARSNADEHHVVAVQLGRQVGDPAGRILSWEA